MIKLENISFDHCIKCTICTVYCPVAKATHLFPGPKQSGPDAERLRMKSSDFAEKSLTYCTNCKRCEVACPSDVKIADFIHQAKWNHLKKKKIRIRDFIMSHTDLVGSAATKFSTLTNFFVNLQITKFAMYLILKIPYQKAFPKYEKLTFSKWFKKNSKDQSNYDEIVTYFHGCFVNYNNHSLGKDLIKVLNAMGVGVQISDEKCCGVPLIANGYLDKAKKNGIHNIKALSEKHKSNKGKIIATSSSCTYALKHEYAHLLQLDNSEIKNNIDFITKYIFDKFENGLKLDLKPVNMRVAYHTPCHLERMGGTIYTIDLLKRIPGLELVILSSECCGIAGTYGFKSEYYEISQEIGSDLFKLIEDSNPEYVVTDCETCTLQIEMNTKYKVLHPITILAMALKK